jgi:hypothetical protein
METPTDEQHPEGLLIKSLTEKDWESALTVILHSPHYTKRRHTGRGLHIALYAGAPIEVVAALLEAYPDATRTKNYIDNLPCHIACIFGTSSEGMKMLLRCNPDAASVRNDRGETPMNCIKYRQWESFAEEQAQVTDHLEQHPSYWKSKEQQALLQSAFEETDRRRSVRRSVARIILGRQLDIDDLVPLIIEYL